MICLVKHLVFFGRRDRHACMYSLKIHACYLLYKQDTQYFIHMSTTTTNLCDEYRTFQAALASGSL